MYINIYHGIFLPIKMKIPAASKPKVRQQRDFLNVNSTEKPTDEVSQPKETEGACGSDPIDTTTTQQNLSLDSRQGSSKTTEKEGSVCEDQGFLQRMKELSLDSEKQKIELKENPNLTPEGPKSTDSESKSKKKKSRKK